jgi:hypothetical protein
LSEAGESSGKVKVVDRRRFTEEGDLRPDWESVEAKPAPRADASSETTEAASPPKTTAARPAAPPEKKAPEPSDPAPSSAGTSPLFMELVSDLAQQAALFLNGAEGLPANPAQSQRLIDYLGVLETKTRGNLSTEESQMLSNVIFQLRTLYVQRGS